MLVYWWKKMIKRKHKWSLTMVTEGGWQEHPHCGGWHWCWPLRKHQSGKQHLGGHVVSRVVQEEHHPLLKHIYQYICTIKYENIKCILIFVLQIDPLHFPKRAGPWDCNLPFSLLTRGTSNVHAMITVCTDTQWSPDARPGIAQFTACFAPWPIVSQTCT